MALYLQFVKNVIQISKAKANFSIYEQFWESDEAGDSELCTKNEEHIYVSLNLDNLCILEESSLESRLEIEGIYL